MILRGFSKFSDIRIPSSVDERTVKTRAFTFAIMPPSESLTTINMVARSRGLNAKSKSYSQRANPALQARAVVQGRDAGCGYRAARPDRGVDCGGRSYRDNRVS